MIGKTLGHYQITSQLGKGGMGEVFQAKDQILGRDVAIKVLPEEFAKDTDRVARFQREAKLLASLNHPNIAVIHGLEESGGSNFLVMELVEGGTLADRIKAGPIPVEESLKLALQIAEALEAAHDKGVIHRDLKPANIKVTPDGKVKVLDFGLAKAYAGDKEEVSLSNSPTLSDAATQQGIILGTAAYMSPEQARGESVDRKADIWAFGVVLFEMLTGRTTFEGRTVSDTLASVLARDPKWQTLPSDLHPRIRLLLERCLEKDAKDRYSAVSDARVDIQKALADSGGVFAQPVTWTEPHMRVRSKIPWLVAILGIFTAAAAVWNLRTPEPPQIASFYYELAEKESFNNPSGQTVAVSPDGRQFAYSTEKGLYLRPIEELDARLIIGTANDNPSEPLFSSDGKWLVYYSLAESKIKKIPVAGGVPIAICNAPLFGGMNWGAGNTILYGGADTNSATQDSIMQVSANGGTPNALFKEKGAVAIGRPQLLPGGKSVLFTKLAPQQGTVISRIMARSLEHGESKVITAGYIGRYIPTGHLVYTNGDNIGNPGGNLFAVPFDSDDLEITGEAVPIGKGISGFLGVRYDVSDSGTLVYIPGTGGSLDFLESKLAPVWVDRHGKQEAIAVEPGTYVHPKISPDGTKLAFTVTAEGNEDIWIYDLVRETKMRLTFEEGEDSWPVWTPDSKRIVYRSSRDGTNYDVNMKSADGFGEVEKIAAWPVPHIPGPFSWSKDGKTLLSWDLTSSPFLQTGIGALSLEKGHTRVPLLDGKSNEDHPQISPNGRWLAYASNKSGKNEVYVCPFPEVSKGQWQISTSRGAGPLWAPNGRELFYRNGESVMAVPVETDTTFKYGKPQMLFQGQYLSLTVARAVLPMWDIHPDGKKFLMINTGGKPPDAPAGESTAEKPPTAAPRAKINIVLNWTEELKQRVPVQ